MVSCPCNSALFIYFTRGVQLVYATAPSAPGAARHLPPHRAAVSYDWAGGRAGVNRSCQTCSLVRVRACACVRGEETQEQARGGHGRSTARRRDIAVTGAPALRRALTAPPRLAIGHPRKDWAGPGRPG